MTSWKQLGLRKFFFEIPQKVFYLSCFTFDFFEGKGKGDIEQSKGEKCQSGKKYDG